MLAGVAAFVLATPVPADAGLPHARRADFGQESASRDVRHIAHWIADSRDNGGAGFFIVDKKAARLFVFDADARLRGSSPVLLGAAPGDHSVPGIGTRPMNQVRPEERTTPAGRFVSEQGTNLQGEDVTWVDYDSAVSMHRVRTGKPAEQRLARLATPTVADNRISYGCINVPVAFYEARVRPQPGTRSPAGHLRPAGSRLRTAGVRLVHGARRRGRPGRSMRAAAPCSRPVCAGVPNSAAVRVRMAACVPPVRMGIPFHAPLHSPNQIRGSHMNNIVYIVGAVVIILAVLSFFGFR